MERLVHSLQKKPPGDNQHDAKTGEPNKDVNRNILEAQDEAAANPDGQEMQRPLGRKYKTVVVAASNNSVRCPECDVEYSDEIALRSHIFQCRVEHNVDPLLPLQVLFRQPREEGASTNKRRLQATPAAEGPVREKKYNTISPSRDGALDCSTKHGNNTFSEDYELFVRKIEPSASTLCKSVIPPSIANRMRVNSARPSTGPRSVATTQEAMAQSRSQQVTSDLSPAKGGREKLVCWSKLLTMLERAASFGSPPQEQQREESDGGQDDSSSNSFSAALQKLAATFATVEEAKLCPPADDIVTERYHLDLSCTTISAANATALARVLSPCRGLQPLPLHAMDLRSCVFEDAKSCFALLESLVLHPHIEEIVTDATFIQTLGRGVSPSRRAGYADQVLAAVQLRCHANAERMRRSEGMERLKRQAEAFKRWEASRVDERALCSANHGTGREEIIRSEVKERIRLSSEFAATLNAQHIHEKKQRIQEKKQLQRTEVANDESRERGFITVTFLDFLMKLCEQSEEHQRKMILVVREKERIILRVSEREQVFRAKVREQERVDREHIERLDIEKQMEVCMLLLLHESSQSLEMMSKQKSKHKAFALWKKRQRDEVDQLVKIERSARDSLEKEEDAYFISGREKLIRTIEGIVQRHATQRENMETGEKNVREILEKNFNVWSQLVQAKFESESRLIHCFVASRGKEAARVQSLAALPSLSIEGLNPNHLMYCAATAGHPAPEPVPLFPETTVLKLSMPQDWQHKLHEVTLKSKKCVQEEQTAYFEHLQFLNKFAKIINDAHQIVFTTPNEELRARFMHPPTRMQMIMGGGAGSPTQASRGALPVPILSPSAGGFVSEEVLQGLGVSTSGSSGGGKSKGSKRKMSTVPIPLEPVTDPAYLAMAEECFKWRVAWADRFTPQHIRSEKERIHHAFVEVVICESSSPKDVTRNSHRLLSNTRRLYYADDVPQQPLEIPFHSKISRSASREFDASDGSDDDMAQSVVTLDNDADFSVSAPSQPSASRSIRVELVPGGSNTQSMVGRDDENSTNDNSPMSTSMPMVLSAMPPTSPGSQEALGGLGDASGGRAALITPAQVAAELQNILFQCVVDGKIIQDSEGVGIARIDFTVGASVQSLDVYTDAMPQPDVFGYQARAPDFNRRVDVIDVKGSVFVIVVPSYFYVVPANTPLPISLPPRVLVEKQMDEVVVLPQLHRVDGCKNIAISKVKAAVISSVEVLQGFTGGTITVEVVNGNHNDRLSIRDDLPSFKLECLEKTRIVKSVILNGAVIGEIIEGSVQSTKFVTAANNLRVAPKFVVSVKDRNAPSTRIGPDAIRMLLMKLRYHNFADSPDEGRRIVRISLKAPSGACSILDTHFEVEGIDKPTELRIAHPRLTHRAPFFSCPPTIRGALANFFVPLFPQVIVFDEDTDRFSGGHLRLTLNNGVKGDSIVFVPDSKVLSHIDNAMDARAQFRIEDQTQVIYEDRVVASMTEGVVASDFDFVESGGGGSDCTTLLFEFAHDDLCSISAVQALLRHVAFYTNPGLKLPHNTIQQRDIVVDLQIQDNEQPTFINETISIKGAGHALQLPDKAAMIDFKEGSAAVKLGNLDLSNDRIKPINSFAGAYILAYVGEGYTEGDSVGLKQDDSEFKILDTKKPIAPTGKQPNKPNPRTPIGQSQNLPLLSANVTASFKDRVKQAVDLTKHSSQKQFQFQDVVGAAQVQKDRLKTKQEIHFAGMSAPMASLQLTSAGGVLVNFYKDTKKDSITRKQVVTILRNLTFFATPNPTVTSKVVRVIFADEACASPSQVLVGIRLESVDDVTEIRMKSPKKQCLQQAEINFPICPFGRSILADEDTEYFDGGCFVVQCIAGSSKGDYFSILPPWQQSKLPLQRQGQQIDGFTTPQFTNLVFTEERLFLLEGQEVGRVDITSRDGGVSEIRIFFGPRDPSSSPFPGRNVPIALASYMMNSVLYGNAADKLRDTSRQFLLRISDALNPIEGKLKIQLDLQQPHFAFIGGGQTAVVSGMAASFANLNNLPEQFFNRMQIGASPASIVNVGSRIVVNCDTLHENKNSGGTAGGSIEIIGTQMSRVAFDIPQSYFDDAHLTLQPETGEIYTNTDPKQFVLRVITTPQLIEFSWCPVTQGVKVKAMNRQFMQQFLRSIQVRVLENLEIGGGQSVSESAAESPGDASLPVGGGPNMETESFQAQSFQVNTTNHEFDKEPPSFTVDEVPVLASPRRAQSDLNAFNNIQISIERNPSSPVGGAEANRSPVTERNSSGTALPPVMLTPAPPSSSVQAPTPRLGASGRGNRPMTPATNAATARLTRVRLMPDDDQTDDLIVVRWRLHDGKNLAQLTSILIPRKVL